MRVAVDPRTRTAVGAPELIAKGMQADDFCIDERAGIAYMTTHRENTIVRVPLDPHSGESLETIAGSPFDGQLIGPSSMGWGPGPKDAGSVAYVTTDGGYVSPPPDGIVRPAKVLRIKLG
jgi:hypothetical protein